MTWTAPAVDRPTSPNVAAERDAAEGLLEYHRATLLWKCAGLTGDRLATRAVPPSSMSLLGLVRHMADVERVWFRRRVAGEQLQPLYWSEASPDADFDDLDPAGRAQVWGMTFPRDGGVEAFGPEFRLLLGRLDERRIERLQANERSDSWKTQSLVGLSFDLLDEVPRGQRRSGAAGVGAGGGGSSTM